MGRSGDGRCNFQWLRCRVVGPFDTLRVGLLQDAELLHCLLKCHLVCLLLTTHLPPEHEVVLVTMSSSPVSQPDMKRNRSCDLHDLSWKP